MIPVRRDAILTWIIANLVIGFAAAVPLLIAIPLASYLWNPAPQPGNDLPAAVTVFLIGTTSLTAIALFANRALCRRLATTRWQVVAYWSVTMVVLLSPTVYFLLTKP